MHKLPNGAKCRTDIAYQSVTDMKCPEEKQVQILFSQFEVSYYSIVQFLNNGVLNMGKIGAGNIKIMGFINSIDSWGRTGQVSRGIKSHVNNCYSQ